MQDVIAANPNVEYPKFVSDMSQDAEINIKLALDKFEKLFGKRPAGLWPSEHCISEKTLQLFKKLGIKWTITDEGVLERTLNKEFVRDFRGYLEDPYEICHSYRYKPQNIEGFENDEYISLLFRDAVIPNLIGFEYPHHDPIKAANDLYDRIKTKQKKLESSPDKMHILTIAMDGENCWENYPQDGQTFLETLYSLIEEDENLETVRVSDYIEKVDKLCWAGTSFELQNITAGSWINRDFLLWIGEKTKNLAWKYLDNARKTLQDFQKENPDFPQLQSAWEELWVSQGSDWYWWYGEPNDSGQDDIFDHLFREHLKNVYKIIQKPIPKYLENPLTEFVESHSRYPKKEMEKFELSGKDPNEKWESAGCIDIPTPPTMQEKKFLNKIYFGYDKNNLYLRFDVNKYAVDKEQGFKDFNQIYIYFKNNLNKDIYSSPVRTVCKTDTILPLLAESFNSEIKLTLFKNFHFNPQLTQAISNNLWALQLKNNIEYVFSDFLEVKIPFDDLRVEAGESIEFFVIQGPLGITDDFYPQNTLLPVERPL